MMNDKSPAGEVQERVRESKQEQEQEKTICFKLVS
jgi:hypothetical protein